MEEVASAAVAGLAAGTLEAATCLQAQTLGGGTLQSTGTFTTARAVSITSCTLYPSPPQPRL